LEGQIAAVQTLLLSPEFGRALAVHNKVQEVWNHWHRQPSGNARHSSAAPSPVSTHAQTLVRDVSSSQRVVRDHIFCRTDLFFVTTVTPVMWCSVVGVIVSNVLKDSIVFIHSASLSK
jgi:hypothetical protein